ncbi:MAG: hypothetical protein ACRENX_05830 [Candidatus Dormibacteria bacterium]
MIRLEAGGVVTSAGPFADIPTPVGGFWIFATPDQEFALEWARKATMSCTLPFERRPL